MAAVTNLPTFASDGIFRFGESLARGAGVVTVALFLIVAIGMRFGSMPSNGAAHGRVLAMKQVRWVGLAAVLIGLILMLIASI